MELPKQLPPLNTDDFPAEFVESQSHKWRFSIFGRNLYKTALSMIEPTTVILRRGISKGSTTVVIHVKIEVLNRGSNAGHVLQDLHKLTVQDCAGGALKRPSTQLGRLRDFRVRPCSPSMVTFVSTTRSPALQDRITTLIHGIWPKCQAQKVIQAKNLSAQDEKTLIVRANLNCRRKALARANLAICLTALVTIRGYGKLLSTSQSLCQVIYCLHSIPR